MQIVIRVEIPMSTEHEIHVQHPMFVLTIREQIDRLTVQTTEAAPRALIPELAQKVLHLTVAEPFVLQAHLQEGADVLPVEVVDVVNAGFEFPKKR